MRRIFTWLAWKQRVREFLHWGYNHWQRHPPARPLPYNPYDNVTGGFLQAGDSFIVYPPVDPAHSRAPVPSIRWEIIGKAMHDYSYLMMFDELIKNDACSDASAALRHAILNKIVPSFRGHTRDAAALLRTRARLAKLLSPAPSSRAPTER